MTPRWRPAGRRGPAGVLVLGMHRSGTSAVTRLVSTFGLVPCRDDDMVRGPWNPTGHYESRTLMHLDNRLLGDMGCSWWYPPPVGAGYDTAAARIRTSPGRARRVFRTAYPTRPWVWKDPRACLLLPFWRAALGPVAAVVVLRNPLEVADSLERRHGMPTAVGVALWERYNRLLFSHASGLPAVVTSYEDVLADPLGWSEQVTAFLTGLGMAAYPPEVDRVGSTVDAGLRHATHGREELQRGFPGAAALLGTLEASIGPWAELPGVDLGDEPPAVQQQLDTMRPDEEPAWRPPPGVAGDRAR